VLARDDLAEVFGIEMAPAPLKRAPARTVATKSSMIAGGGLVQADERGRPSRPTTPAVKPGAEKPLPLANRQALSAA
jgi:hypothetical protein